MNDCGKEVEYRPKYKMLVDIVTKQLGRAKSKTLRLAIGVLDRNATDFTSWSAKK